MTSDEMNVDWPHTVGIALISGLAFFIPFGEWQQLVGPWFSVPKLVLPILVVLALVARAKWTQPMLETGIFALFTVACLVSFLVHGINLLPGMANLAGYIVLILCLGVLVRDAADVERIMIALLAGITLISVLTLSAVVTGFDVGALFGKPMSVMVFGLPRIFGTEENPNAYAVYSCIGMVLAIYAIIRAENAAFRTAAILAGLAIFAVLFLSASRSAAIGAAIGITALLTIYVRGGGAKTACLGLGILGVAAGVMLPSLVASTSDVIFKSFYLQRIESRVHAEIEEMRNDLTDHIQALETSAADSDPKAQAELVQKRENLERLSNSQFVEKIVENAVVYSRASPTAEIASEELLNDKMLADLSAKPVKDASFMVADKVEAAENRVEILIYSARLISMHPIFGVGFLKARSAFVSNGLPVDNAVHNTYVSLAVEFGLPAAILFVGALVLLVYRSTRQAIVSSEEVGRRDSQSRLTAILLPATLISYMVHGTFHDSYMNVLLWLIIALSIAFLDRLSHRSI